MADTKLPSRPIRLGEILWDLAPVGLALLWFPLLAWFNPRAIPTVTEFDQVRFAYLVATSYLLPLGHAVLMQISGFALLRRITRTDWRESLWLAEIPVRPYLLSQFRTRALIQCIPFGIGAVCCVLAAVFGMVLLRREPDIFPPLGFGVAIIYGLFSLQWCALCAAHLGHLDRLRSLCRPNSSEIPLYFTSLKWMLIIGITPHVNGILGALTGEVSAKLAAISMGVNTDSPAALNARTTAVVTYSLIMCTLISLFFYRRLSDSWRRFQDEFYLFE